MVNTYTTSFDFVDDGDATYENPQSLVSTNDDITISNAQIEWRGENNSYTQYSNNKNSDSATATTSTNTYKKENSVGPASFSAEAGFLNADSNETETGYYQMAYNVYNTTNGALSYDITYRDNDKSSVNQVDTLNANSSTTVFGTSFTQDSSPTFNAEIVDNNSDSGIDVEALTAVEVEETTVNSQTASASYPSIPSGYNLDYHKYRKEENGSLVDSGTTTSNSVGDSKSITSNDPDVTVSIEMWTYGEKTVTENTENPSVSGDVSASYSGTLTDAETTGFTSLSGLQSSGNQLFYHNIAGSGQADYRIQFDWERDRPTAVATHRFSNGGTTYEVSLADPSDNALDYNFYRTYVSGDGVLAFDVVDPSDSDALPYYIYHPTYGKLALRKQ